MRPLLLAAALAIASLAMGFTPTEDGLYAVFTTTKGEFAAKLYYEKAPVTVANFVGLAEGTIPHYTSSDSDPVFAPFYDGLTFHRVVADFVIQAGSPNGLGTDGPGYNFPDEIDTTLTHGQVGMLSMANSGANSNGSQFFITLNETTAVHLDGKHALFGKVVSGIEAVNEIGKVATDANGKPTTAVYIQQIKIERRGDAALAFDETRYAPLFDPMLPDLPEEMSTNVDWQIAEYQTPTLRIHQRALSTIVLERSANLEEWTGQERIRTTYSIAEPIAFSDVAPNNIDHGFVRLRATMGRSFDMSGAKLTLTLGSTNPAVYVFDLGSDFNGQYSYNGTTNDIVDYRWYDLESRSQFYVAANGLYTLQCYLNWTSETEGSLYIHIVETGGSTSGTFTFEE